MGIASAFAFAQDGMVLPAHTRVIVQTAEATRAKQLKSGDEVKLLVRRPVRVGNVLVIAAGTPVNAHVAIDPAGGRHFQVEDVRVGTARVAMEGNPLPLDGDTLDEKDEWMPQELRYGFWRPAPYRGNDAGNDPKDLVPAGVMAELRTTGDVALSLAELPKEAVKGYHGDPVIFISDRLREKHGRILCGTEGVLGEHHPDPAALRVPPGTYVLHTDRAGEVSVTVKAERDHRYLIYHDQDGLDAVTLDNRPALLDYMPPISRPEDFFFDSDALAASDTAAVQRDRAAGGCGLIKTLHSPRGGAKR